MTPKKQSDSNELSGASDVGPTEGNISKVESPRILSLVQDTGNRRVLAEWIADHEQYRLADEIVDITRGEFDGLVIDRQSLLEKKDVLSERIDREEAVLPVVLLAESTDEPALRRVLIRRSGQ